MNQHPDNRPNEALAGLLKWVQRKNQIMVTENGMTQKGLDELHTMAADLQREYPEMDIIGAIDAGQKWQMGEIARFNAAHAGGKVGAYSVDFESFVGSLRSFGFPI